MNFKSCMALALLSMAGCAESPKPSPPSVDPQPTSGPLQSPRAENRQSFGEFSFSIPAGWSRVTPDLDKTKAMLLLEGTNWQNSKAMIKIDVGRPVAPTANQLAEGFANNIGGKVLPETMDFDGTPGVHATSPSTDLSTPKHMIVIYRNDKAYLLMVGVADDAEIGDVISQIRKTWKWTDPSSL